MNPGESLNPTDGKAEPESRRTLEHKARPSRRAGSLLLAGKEHVRPSRSTRGGTATVLAVSCGQHELLEGGEE